MRELLRNVYLDIFGFFKNPKPGIHILHGHFIKRQTPNSGDEGIFQSFLAQLNRKCRLIDIQDATELIMKRQYPRDEVLVALTFDDGFEECYTTIMPILDKIGCKAAFFINSNYVNSSEKYREQYNGRVLINTKTPMSWEQIRNLHERGHVIGSHTLDHFNLIGLMKSEVEYQLAENKKILEDKLDYQCEYFAWPFGRIDFFSNEILESTLKYHKYIFSGTNYKHYFSMNGKVINRRQIEPFWPKSHINYFLSINKRE